MSILKLVSGLIQSLPPGVSTALETIGSLTGTGFLRKTGAGAGDWALESTTFTVASTAEAQEGTNNTNAITPLRMREGFNASGTAPVYACRAWVNFNGTGTVSIRASGNVSSITDRGTGLYTVNFTTAMPDANYAYQGMVSNGNDAATIFGINEVIDGAPSASSAPVRLVAGAGLVDRAHVFVAFFR